MCKVRRPRADIRDKTISVLLLRTYVLLLRTYVLLLHTHVLLSLVSISTFSLRRLCRLRGRYADTVSKVEPGWTRDIAGYFTSSVINECGCPRRVRADRGTENSKVRNVQRLLRRNHQDSLAGEKSFVYGQSIANQRIEAWWGILRKENAQFWMNIFSELKDDGDFSGDFLDKSLIQFCFLALIRVGNWV